MLSRNHLIYPVYINVSPVVRGDIFLRLPNDGNKIKNPPKQREGLLFCLCFVRSDAAFEEALELGRVLTSLSADLFVDLAHSYKSREVLVEREHSVLFTGSDR